MQNTLRLLVLTFVLFTLPAFAGQSPDAELDKAVATLRKIVWKDWSDEQKEAKAKEIDAAWKTLTAAGEKGATRLKQEIEKVDAAKEKDDFFKLNATAVLWEIGKAPEAEYIAKVWEGADLSSQYTYVFLTAFAAAQTQDPKVLPMLRVVSKDDKGSLYIGLHAMNVGWPLSHEFLWGAYGNGGLPVLADLLEKSTNEVELKTAMELLGKAQYLSALPRIRQLASNGNPDIRRKAIQAIGVFGHPDDYARLDAGLRSSKDPKDLFAYAFAFYEFEDERAVPHLIPLLEIDDEHLQVETSLALLHLLTPSSLAAVKNLVSKTPNPEVKKFLQRSLTLLSDKLPKDFETLRAAEQTKLLFELRNANLALKAGEKPITNTKLLEALNVWKEKGRIYDSGVDWLGESLMIASATPNDIDLILAAKSAFYKRLSDECLYEVRDLQTAVKYIGRSRYRRGLGVTARAEPK
jgi:HEAT repeat protein